LDTHDQFDNAIAWVENCHYIVAWFLLTNNGAMQKYNAVESPSYITKSHLGHQSSTVKATASFGVYGLQTTNIQPDVQPLLDCA